MCVCVCVCIRKSTFFCFFFPSQIINVFKHLCLPFWSSHARRAKVLLFGVSKWTHTSWIRLPKGGPCRRRPRRRPCLLLLLRVSSSWPGRARSPTARSRTYPWRQRPWRVRFTRKGGRTAARTGTNAGTTTTTSALKPAGRRRRRRRRRRARGRV